MTKGIGTITEYSNWCYKDQLHGKDLVDGEQLRIYWPDGSHTDKKIGVNKFRDSTSDMGADTPIVTTKAYVMYSIHGQEVKVMIEGLKAERRGRHGN